MPCLFNYRLNLPVELQSAPIYRFPSGGLCAPRLFRGEMYRHKSNGAFVVVDGSNIYMTCASQSCKFTPEDVPTEELQLINKHSTRVKGGNPAYTFTFRRGCTTWLRLTEATYPKALEMCKGVYGLATV